MCDNRGSWEYSTTVNDITHNRMYAVGLYVKGLIHDMVN